VSEPINLTQLQNRVDRIRRQVMSSEEASDVADAVLALIDTAEAAMHAVAEVESGPYYYKRVDELGETLNRYTTTP
jgi:hypothetical protein